MEFLRRRYGLPLVVVVAMLVFLVVRALLHERHAGAPPTSSQSAGLSRSPRSSPAAVIDLPVRTGADPTRCPGLRCYTAASVPSAVLAAVRAVFPMARFTAVETIRLVNRGRGNPLWYREVVARAGSATLTLRVQAHSPLDTPNGGAKDDGRQTVSYVDAALQQWFVLARVSDRSGSGDAFDQLRLLVADQRVLAT